MPTESTLEAAVRLAVGALVGLAVGIEREWSGHATGPGARFAGVRTFFLLGVIGAVTGWAAFVGYPALAAVLAAGAVLLTGAAYLMAARREGDDAIEGTTEVAALAVIALGAVAGLGYLRVAGASAALIVLALGEKTRIGAFVRLIGRREMRAALTFAVFALVILPVLPEGPYGPFGGIRPRGLWAVVLLFLALNFAGYVGQRLAGRAAGYRITGLLGGTISSTLVSLTFAQHSRREPESGAALGMGVVAACTVLPLRVTVVSLVLNPAVAARVGLILLLPFVLGIGLVARDWRRHVRAGAESAPEVEAEERNPLRVMSAIRMAVAFQLVLMAIHWVEGRFGSAGVLTSAAVLGLTDVDALTLSMTRLGERAEMVGIAAQAIGIGILANTVLKLTITVVLGTASFRRNASSGLAMLAVVTAAAVWWLG